MVREHPHRLDAHVAAHELRVEPVAKRVDPEELLEPCLDLKVIGVLLPPGSRKSRPRGAPALSGAQEIESKAVSVAHTKTARERSRTQGQS